MREKRGDSSEDRARESWPCHTSTVKWWWGRVPSAPSPLEAVRRADSEVMRAGKLALHITWAAQQGWQCRHAIGLQWECRGGHHTCTSQSLKTARTAGIEHDQHHCSSCTKAQFLNRNFFYSIIICLPNDVPMPCFLYPLCLLSDSVFQGLSREKDDSI